MRNTEIMPIAGELAALYRRDLTRLAQQVRAFTEPELLWQCAPGITNSAGNVALHLEGNLREYVGRPIGGMPYRRAREEEFTAKGISPATVAARIDDTNTLIVSVIEKLPEGRMEATFPENPIGPTVPARQLPIHLLGHLNYHLGQIDYLRRVLTHGTAVDYARL